MIGVPAEEGVNFRGKRGRWGKAAVEFFLMQIEPETGGYA